MSEHHPQMRPGAPRNRYVTSPLTVEMLAPLPEDCPGVIVSEPLTSHDYRRVAEMLERQPDRGLHALQLESTKRPPITDVGFLEQFPKLTRFACSLYHLDSLDGIHHLTDARNISIHNDHGRRMSLMPIDALTSLGRLFLGGHFTDRPALAHLTGLTDLHLNFPGRMPDLNFVPRSLHQLAIYGGSTADITAVSTLQNLNRLTLNDIRQMTDLTPIAEASALRALSLIKLSRPTELFDMSRLAALTELTVSMMKNLTDLRPVLTAVNLTALTVLDLPALAPGSWHDTCVGWLARGKPPFWPVT